MAETTATPTADALKSALEALETASADWRRAATETQHARNLETDCLNRVNQAQKDVDELVGKVKAGAPRESDWYRASNPGFRLPS